MNIKEAAEKEMKRMKEVFSDIKLLDKSNAKGFMEFAKNYFDDGIHFYSKEQYIESFEAFIIAWAYIDIGIKLGMFKTGLKKYFTVD
jgi:hypothetical protein